MIIHCRKVHLQDYDLALLYISRKTKYTKRNIMPRVAKAKVNDSTKSSCAILNKFRQRIPSRNDDVPQSNDEGADNGKQDEGQADSITVKIICEGYGKAVYENIPSSVTIKQILNFWREIKHDHP